MSQPNTTVADRSCSDLPVESGSKAPWTHPETPPGPNQAVAETTNKVTTLHWRSLLFARNAKKWATSQTPGYLCSPRSHRFFVYLFFLNPGKSISKWLGQPNVCALRNWRCDKCLLRRERISVFLSVIFSLEMFPETWKEGYTEELIKLAHIKIKSWCEQPALSVSAPSPASPGT